MTIALQNLNQHLTSLPAGPISDEEAVRFLLYKAWDDLNIKSHSGFYKEKHIDRTVNLAWDPPSLTFIIERHGGFVQGSSRAEIQSWVVDVQSFCAEHTVSSAKQMRPASPRINMAQIVARLIAAISEETEDPWIKLLHEDRSQFKLNIAQIIPDQGPTKTVGARRKRLNRDLERELSAAGWRQEKPNHYKKVVA